MKSRRLLIGFVAGNSLVSMISLIYVGNHLPVKPAAILAGVQYNRTWNAGQNYSQSGEYGLALREYNQMIEMRPNKVDGYTYRAITESELENWDRAIQDNTAGIELLSQSKGIEEQGNAANIVETPYQEKLASVPEFKARLYHNRGYAYAQRGELERAARDFKQAVLLKPDAPVYHGSLSQLYQSTKQYALDVENWKIATVSAPGDPASWTNYGWALYCAGDLPAAMEADRHAMEMSPVAITARYNLGLFYFLKDQWAQAEPLYRDALALDRWEKREKALGRARDAIKTHPNSQALRQAEALLSATSSSS